MLRISSYKHYDSPQNVTFEALQEVVLKIEVLWHDTVSLSK